MTVKELKKSIENLPDDMQVIVQKDAEGNGYSPLQGADYDAVYVPETTCFGDVYSLNGSHDQVGMSDDEWGVIKSKPKALILYPIN